MDELITKNVLLQGRRKIQQQQYSELILNDSYPSVTRHVNEVLISQYASALCELGQTIGDERTERRMKYPAPILFALQRVNESAGNNTGTL